MKLEIDFKLLKKFYDKKEVRIFLQNEIGIDELYVQNLLRL